MRKVYFLPCSNRDRFTWIVVNIFLNYLYASLEQLGIPRNVYFTLVAQRNDFKQKLDSIENPVTRTQQAVHAKNDARKTLELNMRQTIMHYLAGNPAVTSIKHDDMDAMHSLTQTIV